MTRVTKDYAALAKEHLDRAVFDLAYERALRNIEGADRSCRTKFGVDECKGKEPPMPPGHTYVCATECGTYAYRLGPVPLPPGANIPDMLWEGWTDAMLRQHRYIL